MLLDERISDHPAPQSGAKGPATHDSIAIIGAGPTGVYTLMELVKSDTPLFIAVFEKSNMAGVGMPYSPDYATYDMLANIGSIEIPPLTETYLEWLQRQPDSFLRPYGVDTDTLSDRGFYPRLLLGMFFRDQFERILMQGRERGHRIVVRERHEVIDVSVSVIGVDVTFERYDGHRDTVSYDRLIVASGHDWSAPDLPDGVVLPNPWSGLIDTDSVGPKIGIIGTSLSGIDAVVAVAGRIGRFVRSDDGLSFELNGAEDDTRITMLSRNGLLPETDFYCPLPYEPLDVFTDAAIASACALGSAGLFDRLFHLFMRQLKVADPTFAASDMMNGVTADTFPLAVFAERLKSDPFVWARRDLQQTQRDSVSKHTVAWRYTILRMHEPFSDLYALMTDADRDRFDRGLRRVFVDNYAAVPPLSMERLLALSDAGILDVRALGEDPYEVRRLDDNNQLVVMSAQGRQVFDTLVDARGQRAMSLHDLPFATLREQVATVSNANRSQDPLRGALTEGFGLRLFQGKPRVFLATISFLMSSKPFVQGLPGSHEIASVVARSVLEVA